MHPSVPPSTNTVIAPIGAPSLTDHTPLSPPESHADRVVSILGAHPAHFCTGGPSFRLQKSYRYLSSKHHPTHERGTWPAGEPMADGVWEEAGPTYISEHSLHEWWLDGLADWVELLQLLARDEHAALITGRLKAERRTDSYFGRWLVPSKEQAHYADPPSRWLIIDVDDIRGDPEDAESNVKEFISDYLPELETAGVVVAFTGSAGVKGTRVRVVGQFEFRAGDPARPAPSQPS